MGLTVIVLAAGQGTRMQSNRPKVLQPLAGRPLLGFVLDRARALNPEEIRVVYGHGGEQVQAAFPDEDISWHLQAEQLGTGHAVRQASANLSDTGQVLVLCGDVPQITEASLRALLAAAEEGVGLLTADLKDPTGYGRVVRDPEDRVKGIVEHKDASEKERQIREINTGMLAVPGKHLARWLDQLGNDNAQGEYYLTDIIAMAVNDGVAVRAVKTATEGEGLGVNDRLDLARAERGIQQQRAEALMQQGATLADPARLDIRGNVTVGKDVFIDANVLFEGDVILGDEVHVGPNVVLKNVSLGSGTHIHGFCYLEDSTAGAGCSIGPFSRLRPEAQLDDGSKVGNFVEIKKSQVGPGSKVNHLSYIGDTVIGRNVNVGCGTITCNYDGANKHKTVIGDGAFIGSGVELVAPVTIEPGATIGAGSTIGKTAPADQLTVARSRQVTIKGWKRPQKGKK